MCRFAYQLIKDTAATYNSGENKMTTLENQIAELKAGRTLAELKAQDAKTYYKVKSLASKLSEMKAAEKGNFICKEDLVEYKGLIIWILKNKVNYKGYLNLQNAMTILLNDVENKKVVYKTKASIKSTVVSMAINAGLEDVEANLRAAYGFTALDQTTGNSILEAYAQHRLNVLINA